MYLKVDGWTPGKAEQTISITMPPSSNIVPPGPYVVYVVCDGVPGVGQFFHVTNVPTAKHRQV